MFVFTVIHFALSLALGAAQPPSPPSVDTTPHPRRVSQSWPVWAKSGIQALGFKPWPSNPTFSVGTELRLVRRGAYELHLGLGVGTSLQPQFSHALVVETPLGQRITARFGLYIDVDILVGGQASAHPGVTYRRGPQGRPIPKYAPLSGAARLGVGVSLGYDFGVLGEAPIRVFASYQQIATTPFMAGNNLSFMGLASLTAGLAFEVGTWGSK